jgi:hypothetical protein
VKPREYKSPHVLGLDPKTHATSCSCGASWSGLGAATSAEEHLAAATSRHGRRSERVGTLAGGNITTRQAAQRWGLTYGGAFAYLTGLARARLVRKHVTAVASGLLDGKLPRRVRWSLA